VSKHGGFATVHTVRRLTAKNAEQKQFRTDTVTPIYTALYAQYNDVVQVAPSYIYPHFTRKDYENLIDVLKNNVETLRQKCTEQDEIIEKQRKMIEILWHGLQVDSGEEIHAVVEYYMKNIKE
jgi:flagellin-specific chaperone FliS